MDVYDEIASRLPAGGHGRREPAPHALIEVRGPDALDFVQRLCSQDVVRMSAGAAAPAAFLSPKGKLVAVAVVARLGEDRVVLETQSGTADALATLLDRYHFSEKLTIAASPGADATCAEVLGVDVPRALGHEPWTVSETPGGAIVLAGARRGRGFVRCHGDAKAVGEFARDVPELDGALAECLRIVTGHVIVGIDTEDSTLALEPDLDDHVSTTKGCYTGQEIVARIHTYGHVNRRILPVVIATTDPIERGAALVDEDGDAVGRVQSSRAIPGGTRTVAMAVLPNAFVGSGDEFRLATADGPAGQPVPLRPA